MSDKETDAVDGLHDLSLSAIGRDLVNQFLTAASEEHLPVRNYQWHAIGVLQKTSTGTEYTSMTVHVRLQVPPGDEGRAGQLLSRVGRDCIEARGPGLPIEVKTSITSD